jgi:hypothetical protein
MIHQERYLYQRYTLRRQNCKPVGYAVRLLNPDGRLVMYVETPPLATRADVRVYADETKAKELLSIQSRQITNGSGAFDVFDTVKNEKAGVLHRIPPEGMTGDEWTIYNLAGTAIGHVSESRQAKAMMRKMAGGLVPLAYDIEMNGARVGEVKQAFNPFNVIVEIDFSFDMQSLFDRRLGIAACILLVTLEGKRKG